MRTRTAGEGRNEHGVYVSSYNPGEREREGAERNLLQQHYLLDGNARRLADFCSRFRELAVGGQPFSSILPRE